MAKKGEELKFEEAFEELEKTIEKLESGTLDLDKALEEFNKGVNLVKECNSRLEEAKKEIEIFIAENGQEIPWERLKGET